jgi:acetate kinase
MKPANPRIRTISGGSSNTKFAPFEAGDSLRRVLERGTEKIGLPEATLLVKGLNQANNLSLLVTTPDHTVAVCALMDWIEERSDRHALNAAGHRVPHGGPKHSKPQRISTEMVEELHRTIDRLPQTGDKGAYLKRQLKDSPIEHKQYIDKISQDTPEIRNW